MSAPATRLTLYEREGYTQSRDGEQRRKWTFAFVLKALELEQYWRQRALLAEVVLKEKENMPCRPS